MKQPTSIVGAPLGATMFRMAVPGVIGSLLFSILNLVEASLLKQAGADALAAVAVVFPLVILAAMLSAGGMGGAVSGFTARALGAGDRQEAESVLVCTVLISLVGGVLMWLLVSWFGPLLFDYAGGSDVITQAATRYAALIFPCMPAFWLLNMLSSVMRGAGDMTRPAIIAGVMLIVYWLVASQLIPAANRNLDEAIRAAAYSMIAAYGAALVVTLIFTRSKQQPIRFRPASFRWRTLAGILKQGLLASTQSTMTVTYAVVTTVLFSRFGTDWLAGFGLAVRLELIMVPIIFGIGASLIAIVGAYVGAGQRQRAIAIAWRGIFINAALIGGIGILLTVFPTVWCGLVGSDATVVGHCSQSLRAIAPTYAFFALGLGCYLASQGLNTLAFPILGSLLRLVLVATGIFWVTSETSVNVVLALVAFAVVAYGVVVALGLRFGAWRE